MPFPKVLCARCHLLQEAAIIIFYIPAWSHVLIYADKMSTKMGYILSYRDNDVSASIFAFPVKRFLSHFREPHARQGLH